MKSCSCSQSLAAAHRLAFALVPPAAALPLTGPLPAALAVPAAPANASTSEPRMALLWR